jgi:hypothetical protein
MVEAPDYRSLFAAWRKGTPRSQDTRPIHPPQVLPRRWPVGLGSDERKELKGDTIAEPRQGGVGVVNGIDRSLALRNRVSHSRGCGAPDFVRGGKVGVDNGHAFWSFGLLRKLFMPNHAQDVTRCRKVLSEESERVCNAGGTLFNAQI